MIQLSPLGRPSDAEFQAAKKVIIERLMPESQQKQQAATALLWWYVDDMGQSTQYMGHSSPYALICAEQACIGQLGGIIPTLTGGKYSILYLYHVNGLPPCERCVSQFEEIAAKHALRVYHGNISKGILRVSDFVKGQRYDLNYT